MTEYLDHCDSVRSPSFFHLHALKYILPKYHSNPELINLQVPINYVKGIGEENLQLLFDKAPISMRMYGSAKELGENVKIFSNFPGSDRYFKAILDAYSTTPVIYDNLKGDKKYISKPDLFVMLQSMVVRVLPAYHPQPIIVMVAKFLKSHEQKLVGYLEFVPFDQKVFDEIWKEVQEADKEIQSFTRGDNDFEKLIQELCETRIEGFFEKLKPFLPAGFSQLQAVLFMNMLNYFEKETYKDEGTHPPTVKAIMFTQIRVIIKHLQSIIKKRPEMFLPRTGKAPITVRMFEDGDVKFVMKAELFSAMRKDGSIRINYTDMPNLYDTMNMQDVLKQYGKKFKNIEFVRYPIQRAKHRAVPVGGLDPEEPDEFCILAVDVVFDYFRMIILENKAFQIWNDPDENSFHTSFDMMERFFFIPERKNPYFLRSKMLKTLGMGRVAEGFTQPTKEIRNAKKDGFTVQNLKNELAYLCLVSTFDDIQDYAEVVYAHVDKVKKGDVLRTCDLIDAVEYCQLICIFERLPNYKTFLHNQGGCGRIPGLKCALCEAKKQADAQPSEKKKEVKESVAPTAPKSLSPPAPSDPAKPQDPSQLVSLNAKISELEAENSRQSSLISQLLNELVVEKEKSKKLQEDKDRMKGLVEQINAIMGTD